MGGDYRGGIDREMFHSYLRVACKSPPDKFSAKFKLRLLQLQSRFYGVYHESSFILEKSYYYIVYNNTLILLFIPLGKDKKISVVIDRFVIIAVGSKVIFLYNFFLTKIP